MKSLAISGSLRENVGKKQSKALRVQDLIPCVLYGGKEQVSFSVTTPDVKELVYNHEVHTVELNIGGAKHTAIMKDLQLHPVTDRILHIDFLELFADKPVVMNIPVRITGSSIGVKAGGKLVTKARTLAVRSLPKSLPDFIEINIDKLDLGKSIKVSDINLKGVEILDNPNNVVTGVETTRATASAAAAATTGKKK